MSVKRKGLIASLPAINKRKDCVFVMHEKSEKLIPLHSHNKGQLSYVEGGIAYITVASKTYVVPARHYFWIPKGMKHVLRIGHFATVLRSLYFYAHDDNKHSFYSKLGIYPASELLIQMINYTEKWDGCHVDQKDEHFAFLIALKQLLPELNNKALPIILPVAEDDRMKRITKFLEKNYSELVGLKTLALKFNMSERSVSRLFQSAMQISFFQYLKTLRMTKAIELILKTDQPISDIAFHCGYKNIGAFSNAFYEFTNARPTDFRKVRSR